MNKYEALITLWRKRAQMSQDCIDKYLPVLGTMSVARAEVRAYNKCSDELEEIMKQEEPVKPKRKMVCELAKECSDEYCVAKRKHDAIRACGPNRCSRAGRIVQCVPVEDNKP